MFFCVFEAWIHCDAALANCSSPIENPQVSISSSDCDEHFWPILPVTALTTGAVANTLRAGAKAFAEKCGARIESCFRRMRGSCCRSRSAASSLVSLEEGFLPNEEG